MQSRILFAFIATVVILAAQAAPVAEPRRSKGNRGGNNGGQNGGYYYQPQPQQSLKDQGLQHLMNIGGKLAGGLVDIGVNRLDQYSEGKVAQHFQPQYPPQQMYQQPMYQQPMYMPQPYQQHYGYQQQQFMPQQGFQQQGPPQGFQQQGPPQGFQQQGPPAGGEESEDRD